MMKANSFKLKFAEVINMVGQRLHVGCLMAAGQDWVEVSMPENQPLVGGMKVRFLPSDTTHDVVVKWRKADRAGFLFVHGGPPEDHFAGIHGLMDPRSASQIMGTRVHENSKNE